MVNYKKLSSFDVNPTPDPDDLVPTLVDNGDGSYSNELIPYSSLKGEQGDPGNDGDDGEGVPTGGATGQYLIKISGANFDTAWSKPTKADVGLSDVDNTSDEDKPVSTAQSAAIDAAIASAVMGTSNISDNAITYAKLASGIFSGLVTSQSNSGTGGGTFKYANIGGIKIAWGTASSNAGAWYTIDYTNVGFASAPVLLANTIEVATPSGWVEFAGASSPGSGSPSATACSFLTRRDGGNSATTIMWFAIGT